MRAGSSLEEVYYGLREGCHMNIMDGEKRWIRMSHSGAEYEPADYFPQWRPESNHGKCEWKLCYPIEEFIPRCPLEPYSDTDSDSDIPI